MKKWFLSAACYKKSNYGSGTIAIVEHVLLLMSWLSFAQFVPNVSGLRACVCVYVLECVTATKQGNNRVSEMLLS